MRHGLSLVLLAGVALFWAAPAGAISRVGNCSIGDAETGFEAAIPKPFEFGGDLKESGVVMEARLLEAGPIGAIRAVYFEARDLAATYVDLDTTTREAFESALLNKSGEMRFRKVVHSNSCVSVMEGFYPAGSERPLGAARAWVLGWGPRRGVVIVGAENSVTIQAMEEMVASLTLANGACLWK